MGTGRHDGGGGAGMTARLELVWPGKDKFLLVPKDVDGKPVWVERDHPAASEVRLTDVTGSVGEVPNEPFNANLLFTGDSLDVLRVLTDVPGYRSRYRGKVKLVYIDPPFNTGQAFEHYDDWMEHSTWLSFMRERLLLIRELLAPDGSVWVHLDDAEQHRMRLLNRTTATRWWKFGTVLTVGAPGLRHLGRGARRGCGLTTRCTSPSTPGLWEG